MLVEMRAGLEDCVEEAQQSEPAVSELAPASTPAPAEENAVEAEPKKKRAPRRKLKGEEGVVERPLFPFYEQTLF